MPEVWLILETSGRGGQVGVIAEGKPFTAALDPTRRHNRDLASTVRRLLAEAQCPIANLSGVMVSLGPGSYTGLRVGIMSAKMLAFTLNCPLRAVPTFDAIAQQLPDEGQQVEVLSDGLQGLIYRQRFQRDSSGRMLAQGPLQIVQAAEWARELPADCWLSGPGVGLVDELVPAEQLRVEPSRRVPGIESVYQVGKTLAALSEAELFQLEPLYLRPSSAEEQAARKQAGQSR